MAITYEKVIGVISHAPVNRKDFEVNNLLPWFRKKSELFRNLKQELLFDLIKNLKFVTKKRDELVIKQFDFGDTMYILLRGEVTIFMLYPKKIDEDNPDGGTKEQAQQIIETTENIRQQLGTFVTNLGPGATFGEIALLKDDPQDCKRTASIIANEETIDLIEIDRDLYNRSVKNVLKQEFEDKTNFIANNPFFQNWVPKYKKQLAMALQKDAFQYDSIISKQGEPIEAIFFILRGEVKVIVDPEQHKTQYPKYYNYRFDPLSAKSGEDFESMKQERFEHIKSMSIDPRERSNSDSMSYSRLRRKKSHKKKQSLEVCLLGVNEIIGDIEVLMDLETSLQTAKCTQRTEVLVLEMKHYERLLQKRNPRTIKAMKECLDLRLTGRINEHAEQLPLFKELYYEVLEFAAMSQEQSHARHGISGKSTKMEKVKPHKRTVEEYFNSFIPPPGALIDMHGPGTVFYRIREREKARLLKKQKSLGEQKVYAPAGYSTSPKATTGNTVTNNHHHHAEDSDSRYESSPSQDIDPMTSDPVLRDLEDRMRQWLQWDGSSSRSTPRVSKLHRTQIEEEQLKPGAKVVFRPKGTNGFASARYNTEYDNRQDEDDKDVILHSSSWTRSSGSTSSALHSYSGK